MSVKNNKGAWIVPQEQLIEFAKGINYHELCVSCLPVQEQVVLRKKLNEYYPGSVKKTVPRYPTDLKQPTFKLTDQTAYRRRKVT